ncbi:MAG: MFS transporter [Acidobacteriota bacterium]|nr:MFS transporter [Acidobacteriota bacterium]
MKRNNAVLLPVLVLCGINILNFYDRNAPGALVEPMRREFGLSDTQIGLLGSAFVWIYALAGVPLGRVADVWSRKRLLAFGVLVWTALTALAAFAGSYSVLLFSRLGVGVGEAICAPAGTSWLGDLFPVNRRARVLAIFMLGVPVGGALSYFFSGPIAQAWGWRTAMVVAALPAVLLVPALLTLHEPERGASEARDSEARHLGPQKAPLEKLSTWSVLRIPTLWWIIASGIFLNFNMYAIGTFMPAFLSRVHGMSLARSGVATGCTYLIGGVCGGLLAGGVGDRIVRTHHNGRLLIASGIALLAAPFAYLGVVQRPGDVLLTLVFLTLAYGAFNTYYGLVYASIQDIVPANQRGFTMAIYFMAMYLCGASFGPLLTGNLSDRMARRAMALAGAQTMTEPFKATGLQQAMLIIPALSVALAIVLYFGSRTISGDIARRQGVA